MCNLYGGTLQRWAYGAKFLKYFYPLTTLATQTQWSQLTNTALSQYWLSGLSFPSVVKVAGDALEKLMKKWGGCYGVGPHYLTKSDFAALRLI